ncbi:MAG: hypothetical protein CVU65_13570 [Deltaproteobacteria bacterium HGW-Deltaproteobacteria-22]|jgi:RNA polymerase sigma-70 factor (ECF subfamily)|nr:MAG: hypothetical protein CVU65_13570 [Deltaproteobacteria bacterium HGW-Deltaproteobacteria-22]
MRQASSDTIAELYLAHKDMVYRVCLRFRRGDPEWAADRMQEVFLRLAERWDQLPEMDSPKAFIYRTTMNVCINQVRREQNLVTLLNRFFHKEPSVYTAGGTDFVQPEKAATDAQWLERLDGALASLPVKQRVVVIMYYLEDVDIPEIGRILHLNKGSVSRRLKAARKQLAVFFGEPASEKD